MLWLGVCKAQYYPVPQRIAPDKKAALIIQIKNGLHDKNQLNALLQLSSIYYHRPFKQKSDLDHALSLAQSALVLAKRLHSTADINNAIFYTGEIFIAERNMPLAEQLLNQVDDTTRLKLLLNLSNYNEFNAGTLNGYAPKAAVFAAQALTLAKQMHLKPEENEARLNIANIDLQNNELKKCEDELKKIIASHSDNQFDLLRYTYITYCHLNLDKGNNDKGLYYSIKAINTVTGPEDSLRAGDCYMAQAQSYYAIYNNDLVVTFAKKAIEAFSNYNGESSISLPVNYAGMALTRERKYTEARQFLTNMDKRNLPQNEFGKLLNLSAWGYFYKGEKKYEQAESFYLKVLATAQANHLEDESTYRNVGDVLVQDHKYIQAKPNLEKSLSFTGGIVNLSDRSLVHYYLFLCDSVSGDYLQAMKHHSISEHLDDQLNAIAKTEEVQRLQIKYETEQKEKELKIKDQHILLLKQTNQIEHASLAKAQLVKKETFAGIVVLLTLLAVSVGYYRQKQKVNRIIMRKNKTITHKNEQLQQLLIDKDWLLKEVHHRVKNNLHTVICLLESQANYLKDDALRAIEVSQHRIYAMSLIHQKLYQSADIKTIDVSAYLNEFVNYLAESYGTYPQIQFKLTIAPIKLGISHAIPIALIINEAITNSIKYAFPDGQKGTINIEINQNGTEVTLSIADNGIGIGKKFAHEDPESLGLALMRGLTDDLNGDIKIINENGTTVSVIFDLENINENSSLFTA